MWIINGAPWDASFAVMRYLNEEAVEDRQRILSMLADRIHDARKRRNEAPDQSLERQAAEEELRAAEEALTHFLTLGRLPSSFRPQQEG